MKKLRGDAKMTLAEIKKSLKTKGIGIVAAKATLNGAKAYKIIGSKDHNENALWTAAQIGEAFKHGDLYVATKVLHDDYVWHDGGLYHRGGDTLLPHHSGNWAWLENCDESEAAERAAEWEAQK